MAASDAGGAACSPVRRGRILLPARVASGEPSEPDDGIIRNCGWRLRQPAHPHPTRPHPGRFPALVLPQEARQRRPCGCWRRIAIRTPASVSGRIGRPPAQSHVQRVRHRPVSRFVCPLKLCCAASARPHIRTKPNMSPCFNSVCIFLLWLINGLPILRLWFKCALFCNRSASDPHPTRPPSSAAYRLFLAT